MVPEDGNLAIDDISVGESTIEAAQDVTNSIKVIANSKNPDDNQTVTEKPLQDTYRVDFASFGVVLD